MRSGVSGVSPAVSGSDVAERFPSDRLERLLEIDRRHFWFRGRRRLLEALLGERLARPSDLLDVGCGSGATLAWLGGLGHRTTGVDGHPGAVEEARRRAPEALVALGNAEALPLADASFDGALLLDVLEHVDDVAAVTEVARVVRPGGWVALTVPACPRLWSARDEDAGHLRRYRRRGVRKLLGAAGLEPERLTHYQFALLPLVAASRVVGGRRLRDREDRPPRVVDAALGAVNALEARVARRVDLPWGSSIVAVARKSS